VNQDKETVTYLLLNGDRLNILCLYQSNKKRVSNKNDQRVRNDMSLLGQKKCIVAAYGQCTSIKVKAD